jgi:hypothetical protein
VTRDEKTGAVIECMRKIRLGDLNVYSPKREADWRVSVNLEVPGALRGRILFISLCWEYIALNPSIHLSSSTPHRQRDAYAAERPDELLARGV